MTRTGLSFIKIKNYLEDIVLKAKFINDFAGFVSRENLASLPITLQSPFLVMLDYKLELNATSVRQITMAIIVSDFNVELPNTQLIAIDDAETMMQKLMKRLQFDGKQDTLLEGLVTNDAISVKPLIVDNQRVGVECTLEIFVDQTIAVDGSDWEDLAGSIE